ncbi:putative deoxyribonuclease TATDN2 [Eleutherodactylus coqui]
MADRSASSTRKHKWLSSPEMSSSKYLKSSESRRISPNSDQDDESSSLSRERRRVFYPSESTPRRRLDIGSGVCSTVRARSRQMDRRQNRSTERHTKNSGEALEKERDHRNERNNDADRRSSNEEKRPRTSRDSGPSLLFQRAFSDILGTKSRSRRLQDSETRHSQETKQVEKRKLSEPEELPLTLSTSKSTSSKKEVVSERKRRSTIVKREPSLREMVINVSPKELADAQQETPRLVFLDEDSDKDMYSTLDLADKDPSIGSDFSDVEDMGSLTRFSQEDVFSPCCSVQDDTQPSTYQYESPLSCYAKKSPSSSLYKPPAERNTWRQKEWDSSYTSEPSLLDSSRLSVSSDIESPVVKSHKRSASFDAPWKFDQTTKPSRRSLQILPSPSSDSKFRDSSFIDTHCHLDMLFARLSHRSSFADLRRQYYSSFPREFHGCITDYCDPRTLKRLPWQEVLNEDLVWGAFGCHPHFAQYYNDRLHEDMMMALRHPKAIAFGEMGLDYSHKCSTSIPDQIAVFEKQLKLVVPLGKPLVIHCRGADKDLFKIMKKWLPRDYKIHRHCFTGKYEDIEPFLQEFPNMAVGFTAVLTYPSAVEAQDAVTKIPLDRLIVETDAPFFLPKQVPKGICKFSHPGMALHTVHEIAKLRNLPVKTIMSKLRENTYRIYSI